MGLDATVYRSKSSLPFDPETEGAVLDTDTGEYYFPAQATSQERVFPSETRVAMHKRIGNIHGVGLLRRDVERALSPDSIILSKVLDSSTHCGDTINIDLLARLKNELLSLRHFAEQRQNELLLEFVSNMNALVAAAEQENNPIVF